MKIWLYITTDLVAANYKVYCREKNHKKLNDFRPTFWKETGAVVLLNSRRTTTTGHAASRCSRTSDFLEHLNSSNQAEWAPKRFGTSRNMNALADAGEFVRITQRTNGDINRLVER